MNEQNPIDLTSIWHFNKYVCMSMYKATCVERARKKSTMGRREGIIQRVCESDQECTRRVS